MNDLEYGPVCVFRGRYKGRIFYYDDDFTAKTAICHAGHPLDFVGTYYIPFRFLREPTINDLIERRGEIEQTLTTAAIKRKENELLETWQIHSLWSEKSMIENVLFERRMYGELEPLTDDRAVFLCHSSSDKGTVRMVNDDLKKLGLNPWLDENVIKVGDSIVGKISAGLDTSSVMIVFLSPGSVESVWAKKEWQAFLARQLAGNKVKVLPALIGKCEIPAILADIKYANFTESYHEGLREIHSALKSLEVTRPAE
jgi:hypothetical protein